MFVSPTSQGMGSKSVPDHITARTASPDLLDALPKLGQQQMAATSVAKITSITPSILTAKITDATSESVVAARTAAYQSAADATLVVPTAIARELADT